VILLIVCYAVGNCVALYVCYIIVDALLCRVVTNWKTEHTTVLQIIRICSSLCVYYEVDYNVPYLFLICCDCCSAVILLI